MTTRYIKGVLPWLLLGPLTGPLAEGIVRNLRAGEVALASLYGVALWLTSFDLYVLAGRLVSLGARGVIGW
jgi:hypothetical protein